MGRKKLSLSGLFSPSEEDLSVRANREHSLVKYMYVIVCEASGNAEATPPDRACQGEAKASPYQSLQTENRKYLG